MFDEPKTYYEILELEADATEKDVQESYLKLKNAFSKNATATYSIFDQSQAESELENIENAFQVLSNPERRKEYDKRHGLIVTEKNTKVSKNESNSLSEDEFLLIPPSTEIQNSAKEDHSDLAASMDTDTSAKPSSSPSSQFDPVSENAEGALDAKINDEIEWKGTFIQFVRIEKNVSIEELSTQTKISKNYIRAIEEEQYDKLPAAVFLRGFLIQMCRILKLPEEKVITAYISRYKQNASYKD